MRVHTFALLISFVVMPSIVSAQVSEPTLDELYAGGPDAPSILSVDYPNPDQWYKATDVTFTWPLPEEVVAVAAEVMSEPDTEPMETYRPPVNSLSIKTGEWQEGVQYLNVQFKNDEKWGPYTTHKVMIDNTAPAPFSVKVALHQGDQRGVIITAETTDELSGLSHFELSINNDTPQKLSIEEASRGYFTHINGEGTQTIRMTAYDRAGNLRSETTPVLSLPPTKINPGADPVGYVASEPASLLVAIMAGLMLLIFGYLVYERQRYAAAVADLRREADEIQSQMLRIFSALREEIYDQIGAINKKTRLTKKEKEAVDGLNKALNVSEKLLEKEIKDVKKLLK